jgi:uncharacterized protein (TIGR03086 family)
MELDALYRRSVEDWMAAVGRAPADWSGPTPCGDWTVHDLVNHVVGEDRWTRPLVEGRTIDDVGDSLDGDLLGDEPLAAAREAAEDALAAVADRLPKGGKVHLSYGHEDLGEYLRQLVADHLIHGWDLAAATGQDRALDREVVAEVAAWFRDREAMYRSAGMVAERPASSQSGDPQADLLIAFGRDPEWAA